MLTRICVPEWANFAKRSRQLRIVALAVVLLFAGGGCNFFSGGDVWIYVDNGGEGTLTVSLDDKEVATVAKGKFEIIKCDAGKRRIQVHRGKELLFDGTEDLKKSDKMGGPRKYLLNPDGNNRYRTYSVEYGDTRLKDYAQAVTDDTASSRRAACQMLVKEVNLLPADTWFEIVDVDHVLTPEPDGVWTRKGGTAKRTVLARVNRKDYEVIQAAALNENPSELDFIELADAVVRVLESTP